LWALCPGAKMPGRLRRPGIFGRSDGSRANTRDDPLHAALAAVGLLLAALAAAACIGALALVHGGLAALARGLGPAAAALAGRGRRFRIACHRSISLVVLRSQRTMRAATA